MRWLPIFARGFMIGVMLATLAIAGGCSSTSKPPPPPPPKKDVKLTEHQVQSVTMSMADDIMFSVADACAQVKQRTASPRREVPSVKTQPCHT